MTDARFAGLAREVLDGDTNATFSVGGVCREVLVSSTTVASFGGLVREVLRTNEGIVAPPQRPWLREHFLLDAHEPEDEWRPRRRGRATAFIVPPQPKPWLRHVLLEADELDRLWQPSRLGAPPATAPATARLRPYLMINI